MNSTHRFAWTCGAFTALVVAGCAKEPAPPPAPRAAVASRMPAAPAVATHVSPRPDAAVERPSLPVAPATPEEAAAAWREGRTLFDAGDFARASTKLETASSGRPDDPYLHYLLGLSLWKEGRPKEAEPALARSGSLAGSSIKTWINLARVRLELGENAQALEAGERALAIDALSADALHQKGRALAGLGKRDEALEVLRKAHEAAPENGYIANTLGFWLIQDGQEADAVALLESARDRLPDVAYVRNNLGVAYERSGRTADAVAEFRAAVAAGDTAGKAALSLARLHQPIEPAVAQESNAQATSVAQSESPGDER